MKTKTGRELKIGDIIHERGLIYKIRRKDHFWNGSPSMCYFDVNDAYYGPCWTEIDLDTDYEIETERKTIVEYYRKIDNDLCKFIADHMEDRKKLRYIFDRILKMLNKKQ